MKLARALLIAGVFCLAGLAGQSNAQVIGVNIDSTGGSSGFSAGNFTSGWQFTLSQPLTLTSLGVWDQGGDGLVESHQVGVWNSTGSTLLGSTTVPSGTAGAFVAANSGTSGWRFTSITPLLLGAGTYVIGAEYTVGSPSGDLLRYLSTGLTTAGGLTLDSSRVSVLSGFAFPNVSDGLTPGTFGPNFQAVPEPGSMILTGLALGGAGYIRRRRKAAATA